MLLLNLGASGSRGVTAILTPTVLYPRQMMADQSRLRGPRAVSSRQLPFLAHIRCSFSNVCESDLQEDLRCFESHNPELSLFLELSVLQPDICDRRITENDPGSTPKTKGNSSLLLCFNKEWMTRSKVVLRRCMRRWI